MNSMTAYVSNATNYQDWNCNYSYTTVCSSVPQTHNVMLPPPPRRIFGHVQILPAMLSYPGLKSPRQNRWLGEKALELQFIIAPHQHIQNKVNSRLRGHVRGTLPKCPQSVRYRHPDTCSAWRYCSGVCVKVLNRPMMRSLAHCSSR